ncbi:MAG: Ig-like domain-containing protein [Chthoniobacterales bacterium]
MRLHLVTLVILVVVSSARGAEAPKVVASSPKFWEVGVSSSLKKVSVTFDQVMRSGFWDFIGNNTLPPPTDYEMSMGADLKSFGMQVSMQPGKVYILGLNERGIPGVGFQNDKGISMKPSYLVFQTAGNPSQEDAPPRVTSTSPASNSQEVNPAAIRAISVTFDRAMEVKKHGFHLLEEKKPVELKGVGFTYSPDGKMFTLNYPLKPSTRYEVVMNSTEDIAFAATNRVPLWPFHFSFTTGQPH